MSCHGDNGGMLRVAMLGLDFPNGSSRFESVHFRHLNVHQNGIERPLLPQLQGLASVVGNRDRVAN